ncbi:MAG TPA: tripartite tricarboxylate transporter substrate binding protein [Thermodesulfobacteriota bacterium]
MTRTRRTLAAAAAATLVASGPAVAQEKYPTRPVEIVVTWGPGGGADSMARQLSQLAQPHLGVALPAVNVPGGSGNTGLAQILNGRPDGYQVATYIMDTLCTIALGLASYKVDDLAWVVRTQVADSFLFVKADGPFQTIDALLAHAKANPGKLRVATTGFGTVDDLTVRYLGHRGFPMTVVPYPKPGERYAAVVGGHNEVLYEQAGDVKSFLEAKQLKPLIIFAARRHPAFPDVPASGELGFEVELPQFRGIVARAGTPPDRLRTLAEAFRKAMESAEWKKFAADWYMRPDSYMGPDQFPAWIREQENVLNAYVKEFGLKAR